MIVPNDWRTSTIAELCEFIKGTAPIQKTTPGPYPLVTTAEERRTADHYQLDCEAVCVPMISSTGHGHASLKRVHYQSGKFALSNLLTALRVRDKSQLSPRFLALYLQYFKDQLLVPLMVGAANMSLTADRLASVAVSFPCLACQNRLLALLDDIEELRKVRAQADRRTADLIPALFYDMFGDPTDTSFPVTELSGAAEVVSGVAKGRRFNGQPTVVVPYLRVANVQAGHLDLSEIKTIEALPSEVEQLALRVGDVLLTEGGDFDKLGRGAQWEGTIPNCIHQNHIFRVRVDSSKLLPIYFTSLLQTPSARTYFLRCSKRTTNLASINMTQLRGLPVPVPPLTLQDQFARVVAEIRALEAQEVASRRRLDDLFDSMLHRAFRGEL